MKVTRLKWQADNPEAYAAIQKRARENNREKRIADAAAWRIANPERVKEYQVAYDLGRADKRNEERRTEYAANPEEERAKRFAWREDNRDLVNQQARAAKARRRARKAEAGGLHTRAEIEAIFAAQEGLCGNPYCRIPLTEKTRHLDHIYPLFPRAGEKQGSNGAANLQWTCQPCNQRKTNMDPKKWLDREAERHAKMKASPPHET